MKKLQAMLLCFLFIFCVGSYAKSASSIYQFKTAQQAQQFQQLTEQLRCLVCQNQSLADSGAGLANDLKAEIHEMVLAGKTNQQIIDFLVDRYGDFVLYKPPLQNNTILLWLAPLILLLIAATVMFFFIRRNKKQVIEVVSGDKRERLKRLLK